MGWVGREGAEFLSAGRAWAQKRPRGWRGLGFRTLKRLFIPSGSNALEQLALDWLDVGAGLPRDGLAESRRKAASTIAAMPGSCSGGSLLWVVDGFESEGGG